MTPITKTICGLAFLVAGLIFAHIVLSNAFSVDGIALSTMNKEIADLDRQNMILKEQVYSTSSYTTVASDAATMGFVEEKSQISINGTGNSSIAIRQ